MIDPTEKDLSRYLREQGNQLSPAEIKQHDVEQFMCGYEVDSIDAGIVAELVTDDDAFADIIDMVRNGYDATKALRELIEQKAKECYVCV